MSRALHFDSVGGASGDMVMAALLDLGADLEFVRSHLAHLPIHGYEIDVRQCSEHGLRGTRVSVRLLHHEHAHRGLAEIRDVIEAGKLANSVRTRALAVFARLAEAESRVHGVAPEEVHFHEVGAVDAIVDIVGSCLALESLGVQDVSFASLPLGTGTTRSAHGLIPVPAPATVELLKECPVVQTEEDSELVTPTGAALLSTWRTRDKPQGPARITATGHGFGHRELKARPNLLRALLMEPATGEVDSDTICVLECNLDDMVPELIGSLAGRLMAAHALDVYVTPIQMKKQRPAQLLTVLCSETERNAIVDLIFRESTTFGVREYTARRTVLQRHYEEAETPYGTVRIKVGRWRDTAVTRAPEYNDCERLARERNVPVRKVYDAALAAALCEKG